MKDTEISVAGKVVGEYDMCPDPKVVNFTFDDPDITTTDSGQSIVVGLSNDSINKFEMCYRRNMHLHFIYTVDDVSYDSVFRFMKDCGHIRASGQGGSIAFNTPNVDISVDINPDAFMNENRVEFCGVPTVQINIASTDVIFKARKFYATTD